MRATAEPPPPTPLPWLQIFVAMNTNLINAMCSLVTMPFVPFMVLGMFQGQLTEEEVGYYSGMIEGSFHLGSLLGSIMWGHISDKYGRRPVMLLGLAGTIVSALGFGFSRSFYAALISKFVWGVLNGNVGAATTVLSELTDKTNITRAMSFFSLAGSFGRLIGPACGGLLSNPAQQFPRLFGGSIFWESFPYLLPCAALSSIALVTFIVAFFFFRETAPRVLARHRLEAAVAAAVEENRLETDEMGSRAGQKKNDIKSTILPREETLQSDPSSLDAAETGASPDESSRETEEGGEDEERLVLLRPKAPPSTISSISLSSLSVSSPSISSSSSSPLSLTKPGSSAFSLRKFFTDEAISTCAFIYALHGFVAIATGEVFPLYVLADSEHGGFNWQSREIGHLAMWSSIPLMLTQMLVFERAVNRLGLLTFLRLTLGLLSFFLILTPLCSLWSEADSYALQATLVTLDFVIVAALRNASFMAINIIRANCSAPAERGKVNGYMQALSAAMKVLGPPVATSLFAWSISVPASSLPPWLIINASFVWCALGVVVFLNMILSYRFPEWIAAPRAGGPP